MIRFLQITVFTLITSITANSQNISQLPDSLQKYIDTVFSFIQRKSLYRNQVNWRSLRDSVMRKSAQSQTIQDLMPTVSYLFEKIGDKHGGLYYKGDRYGMKTSIPEISDELKEGFKVGAKIIGKVLYKNYGYLMIPPNQALNESQANLHAQQIQDTLCKLARSSKGWVIDLRMNLGGNMYPMIAGLTGLLQGGILGSFQDPDGKKTDWLLKEGAMYEGDTLRTHVNKGCSIANDAKVAILLSPLTASSGEALAIAFKGRPNTKFFGENTSGFVSANEGPKYIGKYSMLLVGAAFEADRNDILYRDFVRPDVIVAGGDNFTDLGKDKKIRAALGWLKLK